jgi:hypothetical protein
MSLHPDDIKQVVQRYHQRLTDYRDALNDLNVYPVPDGDTGTNMTLTMASVLVSLNGAASMAEVAEAISTGSLMGARGNSGVILSQILRGLTDSFRERATVSAHDLAEALERASAAAYAAVQRPVEGTILTVLREAAAAATRSVGGEPVSDLPVLLRSVYETSVEALERTPDLLPVLKEAGVVDAGGAGLLLLIAAFVEVVTGSDVELPERVLRARADLPALASSRVANPGLAGLRYEVMFMLEAEEGSVPWLRQTWDALGESIVVVGGGDTWNCHIHTHDVGAAIEAGIEAGRPYRIRVTDLVEEAGDHALHGAPRFEPLPAVATAPIGVVAVVAGAGLVEVFRQLGAQGVVTGGQSMNPSTEDLLAVVDDVAAARVIVLPNNKNIVPVAEQLNALTVKDVVVVPTRSVAQGIAAMVGFNPAAMEDPVNTVEDMAAAASAVVTGEITRAVRDATVDFGPISRGDWLGIADGTIVVADADLETALRGLVAAILPPGAELLTLYPGQGSVRAATKALGAWLGELHPRLEICEIHGGQPLYPYLVSIE